MINLENAGEGAPFGQEIRSALDGLMELAKELGFKVRDYDGYAAAVDFGTEGKEVGILSHIDVVPAGNGWTRKPFLPEICGPLHNTSFPRIRSDEWQIIRFLLQ